MKQLLEAYMFATAVLRGDDGRLSFSKLMAIALFWAFVLKRPMPVAIAIALLASSYGVKMFALFLNRSQVAIAAVDTHTVTEETRREIIGRRNGEYEETP